MRPVLGGLRAATGGWRLLFWVVARLAGALLFAVLTFEDQPPADRGAPWDLVAIVLAGGGSASAFFGALELLTHRMLDLIMLVPLLAGVGMITALVVVEYRSKRPLMPVRQAAGVRDGASVRRRVRSVVPHPVRAAPRIRGHDIARCWRRRPERRGRRHRRDRACRFGSRGARRGVIGIACSVHRWLLAALRPDSARVCACRAAARGRGIHHRPTAASSRDDRVDQPSGGYRDGGLSVLRDCRGWRSHCRVAVRAWPGSPSAAESRGLGAG
jgi:hypothetical protein